MTKSICHNGILYQVNDGSLVLMKRKGDFNRDAVIAGVAEIPSVLPDGTQIKKISYQFIKGVFKKIVISDDIQRIDPCAFSWSAVEEVVWPKGCRVIPEKCFTASHVKKVSNIESVMHIGKSAFSNCEIIEVDWPENCNVIPEGCFEGSCINKVNNVERVAKIEKWAFARAKMLEMLDLSAALMIDIQAYAFSGVKRESVVFPYYMSEDSIKLDLFGNKSEVK